MRDGMRRPPCGQALNRNHESELYVNSGPAVLTPVSFVVYSLYSLTQLL